ncbi:MAG: RagB/SusD family nutrient uptake outer membrane protein [Bacteroides sp.]
MKLSKSVTIACAILLSCTSCDDFLSKIPDNRTQLDSPAAVSELLVSAYPDEAYIAFTETMSDNVGDKGIGQYVAEYIPNQRAYFWEDDTSDEDSPTAYWNGCYKAIAHANQALKAIREASNPEDYEVQRGEALATRAYAHFMLVNLFAKHYNPQTIANDPGVPFVTEPENVVFGQYTRNTVAEIYEQVESDLLEAMSLIKDNSYEVPKYHFTKNALYAFASRLYLYKGEWDKVIQYSSLVLGDHPATFLRDWNGKYMNYEAKEMWAQYTKAEETANILLNRAYTVWAEGAIVFRYSLSAEKCVELFEVGTIGLRTFDSVIGDKILQAGGSDQCSFIPKYPDRLETSNGATYGIPNTIIPLFTMEEVLFNRAEAYVMSEQYDKALSDLDAYFQKRSSNYSSTNCVTEQSIRYIYEDLDWEKPELAPFYTLTDRQQLYLWYLLDLRRREFVHEGMRWFDIRRFNFAITHTTIDGETFVLPKDDPRRVLQLPAQAIAIGMEANPR